MSLKSRLTGRFAAIAFVAGAVASSCSGAEFSPTSKSQAADAASATGGTSTGDARATGSGGTGGAGAVSSTGGVSGSGGASGTAGTPGCDTVCPAPPNANPACVAGQCKFTCLAGFADCNGNPSDGCEINTATSMTSCGGCNVPCAAPTPLPAQTTGAVCTGGSCALLCIAGFGNCNDALADGCERDLTSDPNNCGECGNVCAVSTQTCLNGGCVACPTDWIMCGSPARCVDPCLDPNCGGCGVNCTLDPGHCCKPGGTGCLCSGGC